MKKEDQHKIPRVYLRKFGYEASKGMWKVSVVEKGRNRIDHKSINSFTTSRNFFDIDSNEQMLNNAFEKLFNKRIEDYYNNIIRDLDSLRRLSDKSYAYLINFVINLIVRSDHWRSIIQQILESETKKTFLKTIIAHHTKDTKEFIGLESKEYFQILMESNSEEVVNRVLIYFSDHLLQRLQYFEIVILESNDKMPWDTSTNPVIVHNRTGQFEIMKKESELYLPLSPRYLCYLHCNLSEDKENKLRHLKENQIYKVTDTENERLRRVILDNPAEFIIKAGKYKEEL